MDSVFLTEGSNKGDHIKTAETAPVTGLNTGETDNETKHVSKEILFPRSLSCVKIINRKLVTSFLYGSIDRPILHTHSSDTIYFAEDLFSCQIIVNHPPYIFFFVTCLFLLLSHFYFSLKMKKLKIRMRSRWRTKLRKIWGRSQRLLRFMCSFNLVLLNKILFRPR